jgi:hypothetical protein
MAGRHDHGSGLAIEGGGALIDAGAKVAFIHSGIGEPNHGEDQSASHRPVGNIWIHRAQPQRSAWAVAIIFNSLCHSARIHTSR